MVCIVSGCVQYSQYDPIKMPRSFFLSLFSLLCEAILDPNATWDDGRLEPEIYPASCVAHLGLKAFRLCVVGPVLRIRLAEVKYPV